MSSRNRTIILVTCVTIGFLAICGYIAYKTLIQSLPVYDGEIQSSGVHSSVEIYRDSMAVPYILAKNEEDAAFALGYVHAQERLFQMDVMRRAAAGRLSEVFGTKTLAFDQMFRTVGMGQTAEKIWASASPVTKKMLTAYSAGVNKYIEDNKNKLPIEFDILDYYPESWKPQHSILVIRMMAWELNISWWADVTFAEIITKVGRDKAAKLIPDYPENGKTIIPQSNPAINPKDVAFFNTDKEFRKFIGIDGTHIGSNNWVVNGSKAVSGKAMIANDPHLAFRAPGLWFVACIRAGNWNAEGATLPGVPGIVIGKNANISWGLTNVMADDADFYTETLDSSKTKYMVDNSWRDLKVRVDTIKIKDSADVIQSTMYTHRGPIISGTHPFASNGKMPVLSMRWLGNEPGDEYYAFYLTNHAKNWEEFKQGVRNFTVPGQNYVYADKSGNIGYICGAKLPMRNSVCPYFIYDGTQSSSDWCGFVPADKMPELYNPSYGFIASANNKTVKDFPYYITNLWEPSSRIERIYQLLLAKEKFTTKDFSDIQMDVTSPYAKEMSSYIVNAFKGIKVTDQNLKSALDLITGWDYSFNTELQAPAIYAVYLKYLMRYTLADDLGEELFNEYLTVANIPYRVMLKLLKANDALIFDNCKTAKVESRDEIIRKSFASAILELEKKQGDNIKEWQWGKMHMLTIKHTFHGADKIIDKIADVGPYPIGGDGTTINNGEYALHEYHGSISQLKTNEYEDILGPSMRYIFDWAYPDEFKISLPTGQSGNIFSGHYKDMTDRYLQGDCYTIKTDENSIKKNSHLLIITP